MRAIQKLSCIALFCCAFCSVRAQNIDVRILRSVYNDQTAFKNSFFKADAQSEIVFSLAAPVCFLATGLIRHDQQLERDGLFIAGAFALSAVITQSLKIAVQRERPFQRYPQFFTDRYDGGGYSFPSGHVSAAFCTATSLSLYFPKWFVIIPSFLWAASVGWARMYQGVHYPSDVFAGAVVGAASAWAGQKIQKYLERKHEVKRSTAFVF